jgi:pimeloyl-ACP methyl ester carboxylesterase
VRLKRRFVQVGEQVGGRRVHYFRAGAGPPAVLIHSSPANARLLMKEIEHLSPNYTVFAPDTPGFGLSEPLPLAEMKVADLADALSETLAAMNMPPCPIFGSHTGAAIALEFGVRHPERVTGLVLDGVPAFTEAECEVYFRDYFRDLPPTDLGGHYAEVWTRFRDQSIWFPWSERRPENLNPYNLGTPESTHLWASMYFDAADGYKPAYKAASYYGEGALRAAAALKVPAIYTANETDMLFPHMARLPPPKPNQEIRPVTSYAEKRTLTLEGFARFGSPCAAPEDCDSLISGPRIGRQFVDGSHGGKVHLRYAGEQSGPPLLLLHDAPGSSAQWDALIAALGRDWFVIAPDLPGNGESDPFADAAPMVEAYAEGLVALLDRLGVAKAQVYAIGFGASVAVELARLRPERVSGLALRGLLLPEADERQELADAYTPEIKIEPDGAHWYRTWLMLRDSQVWWPWYDRRLAVLRLAPADFDARRLHQWTLDVMRRRESYGRLIQAALRYDAGAVLGEITAPVLLLNDTLTPLSVYDGRLAALKPQAPALSVDGDAEVHAEAFKRLAPRR